MRERVLITGVAGFSGRHLAERLSRDDVTIVGLGRTIPARSVPQVAEFQACDLTDGAALRRAIDVIRPDAVYHLAGMTAAATFDELRAANVDALQHLIEALKSFASRNEKTIRVLVVGSAAELGSAGAARLPVSEDAPCVPESPYGRTKLEATRAALAEPAAGPLQIIVARTFNLVGPGLGKNLSLGRFAQQIGAIHRGEQAQIECGSLVARRDFVDVRDAVDAYVRLLREGVPGRLYNVCSGRSHEIRDLLHQMIELTGESMPIVETRDLSRAGDLPNVYGDPTKTAVCCGWRATTPIEQSLADLLSSVLSEEVVRERSAA
ncbi:MAG: NAD-dependent epimerase/dehydratase family protein [Planctomycetia bacterium]|nr:NAD-dependent epimerase/dehydratase family protein [Planctomycetia bacterium]